MTTSKSNVEKILSLIRDHRNLFSHSIGWSVSRLVGWLVGRMVGELVDWLTIYENSLKSFIKHFSLKTFFGLLVP